MSEGFVFYRSFYDAIIGSDMNEKDQLAAFKAICAYALYGEVPELKGLPYGLFTIAKASIDSNTRKREGGKKGGRPRKETIGSENGNHRFLKTESTETDTDTETDTETETDTDTETETETGGADKPPTPPKQTRFTPPTVEEVAAYIAERGSSVDAQRFVDFYASKGWFVGKNRMKDWKAAVRNWEQRDRQEHPPQPGSFRAAPDAGELARMQRLWDRLRGTAENQP